MLANVSIYVTEDCPVPNIDPSIFTGAVGDMLVNVSMFLKKKITAVNALIPSMDGARRVLLILTNID